MLFDWHHAGIYLRRTLNQLPRFPGCIGPACERRSVARNFLGLVLGEPSLHAC